ncbi:MAG TPA: PAS domain S-box protein, partial [Desulfobaccales bacterium]|nr:PAS domain S-box protein [Desulfobaccales bacterium]
LYVSPQVETLLGFSPEAWRADAENWERQIHPDDRERLLAEITHSLETGEPFSTEYRLLAKSGRVVWFRDEARVVYDPEGQFLFLQGLALDITERKQAEDALRQTTQTLQTLIQASPLAIIALDLDLNIRLWNPGAERMFGWKESEVLGGYLPAVVLENQRIEEEVRVKQEMGGKAQSALELKRVRQDGSIIDVHLWTAPLLDANGKIIGNMGILADITARKRGEEKLRRQAELLDLAHDAIIVRDLDNRIVFWNSGAEETYGWSKAEVAGHKTYKLLRTEFPQPREELEAELSRQGQWQGELSHTRRDGRRIVVTSRWALQRDKAGKPTAILEINRDITGQKQAEAGRARLAAILEATSDLVGTADLKGRVLYLNRAGRKMLG